MKKEYSFWKNKKVLITGHTGFKGSWLSFWLNSLGSNVFGYSTLPDYEPHGYNCLGIKKKIKKEKIGDIRNFAKIENFIKSVKPDIVFHLAAQPLVRKSYSNPIETLETNIIGTANLLEACRKIKTIKSIVLITTDKCYENIEKKNYSYKETDKMGGYDIYSASKGSAELIISSFRRSYSEDFKNCIISSARAGNVIGGGDWSNDRLIPDIIKSIKSKKPIKIRYPDAVRPWQHVLEPLGGYMKLAYLSYTSKKNYLASSWNFGPNKSACISVRQVLMQFKNRYQNKLNFVMPKKKYLHEATYLSLDVKKAKKYLNWTPKWSVKKAIDYTNDWYEALSNKDLNEIKKVSKNQIMNYMKSL